MTYIYLINAHRNPEQLKRLIETLNTDNSKFYIHIDLKSNLKDFTGIIKGENIIFIEKRVNCIWGDFSQVRATLNLVEAALLNDSDSYFVFLSGQCYPIKPIKSIHQFLEKNKLDNFIDIDKATDVWSKEECDRRFNLYRVNKSGERNDYSMIKPASVKKIFKLLIKNKIDFSTSIEMLSEKKKPFEMYGGSSWWAMNFNTLSKVQQYVNNNELSFFKYTTCSDEVFFQSILKELIKNGEKINHQRSLTYVNWEREECIDSPVTFKYDDFSELTRQPEGKLFARKFDNGYDEKILSMLDEHNAN